MGLKDVMRIMRSDDISVLGIIHLSVPLHLRVRYLSSTPYRRHMGTIRPIMQAQAAAMVK